MAYTLANEDDQGEYAGYEDDQGGDDQGGSGSGDQGEDGDDQGEDQQGDEGDNHLIGSGGGDTQTGGDGNDDLDGGDGDDDQQGGDGDDDLSGGLGDDDLDGGSGDDDMQGGAGNDTYHVDSIGDRVVEAFSRGVDTVQTTLDDYGLGAYVENLRLSGSGHAKGRGNGQKNDIQGNAGNNVLQGNGGDDTLSGGDGDDRLEGGLGADRLIGGLGDDTYKYGAGDVIEEADDQGEDTVETALSFTLNQALEHVTLTGFAAVNALGNGKANKLTGNGGDNDLQGEDGDDVLSGGGGDDDLDGGDGDDVLAGGLGSDRMAGGAGDDTYVRGLGDTIVEAANGGVDTVETASAYTLGANLEHARATGGGAVVLNGNALANTLTGNDAANVLRGMAGDDTLSGGGGNDVLVGGDGVDDLTGGAGADVFRFASATAFAGGQDEIFDFSRAEGDRIDVSLLDANTALRFNQAFTFIGEEAFSRAGQIRATADGNGAWVVEGDLNGDGAADFSFVVHSADALTGADFLL